MYICMYIYLFNTLLTFGNAKANPTCIQSELLLDRHPRRKLSGEVNKRASGRWINNASNLPRFSVYSIGSCLHLFGRDGFPKRLDLNINTRLNCYCRPGNFDLNIERYSSSYGKISTNPYYVEYTNS